MAVQRQSQSNAMLYSAIFFALLFIAATVFAVIYYVKAEDLRTMASNAQKERDELATQREYDNRGEIVGDTVGRKSYLATMAEYVDRLATAIAGPVGGEDTSAQVKVQAAMDRTKDMLASIDDPEISADPNKTSLLRAMEVIKVNMETASELALDYESKLSSLQQTLDAIKDEKAQTEEQLMAEASRWQEKAQEVQASYDELKELMEQSAGEQISTLQSRLDQTNASLQDLNRELLRTEAELRKTENRMKAYMNQLEAIKPRPDEEVEAFIPDGKIVSVDLQSGMAILNLGSDDKVYRGLTFAVYEQNAPIPEDGKGKAELEVYDVQKNISLARIDWIAPRQSILVDDPVANLIWDSDDENVFVVAGEFDFDNDGRIDDNGMSRVKGLIEDWGGRVGDEISIKTDFLVLGTPPRIPAKPDMTMIDLDPMANEKYEKAVEAAENYKAIIEQAETFSIPVFDLERFLHFIGYSHQAMGQLSY